MGQYHIPVCPDLAEAFMPNDIGCGLKSAEQLFTRPGTCAALLALASARGGNMPPICRNRRSSAAGPAGASAEAGRSVTVAR